MDRVFLLLGSNLGDRLAALKDARYHISRKVGEIITVSSIFQTASWGGKTQPDFYNQALEIQPLESPLQTLKSLLDIEKSMGRKRLEKWDARLIDIDILLWGDLLIHQPELVVPHPYLHLRRFALAPLVEIAPDVVHPMLDKTIRQVLDECTDVLPVNKVKL
jgi:2-amino-4-hydroxy-6-hydroxymethyldihydropteridine diphosphokinase